MNMFILHAFELCACLFDELCGLIIYLCALIIFVFIFLAPSVRAAFYSACLCAYFLRALNPVFSVCLLPNQVARGKRDTARSKVVLQRQSFALLLEML